MLDLQGHLILIVGVRRLELPTSTSRTWRASQLCYTPDELKNYLTFLWHANLPVIFKITPHFDHRSSSKAIFVLRISGEGR